MSLQGTDAYRDDDPTLPALVVRAVGLAWPASGARSGVRLLSVERDPERG
ncbi:hypothetical protein [Streptomyces sp. 049-1]